ncbi:hypothetical protein, partial [Baaleninema sp.]|uniref:hypothetical protein n=1 Tax=Baaleninema sp. TaxID=3101197 RepID=UPI003CFF1696
QPDAALLDTESWLCLSVSQPQASGDVSYRTLWSYLKPETLTSETPDTEQLSQGILEFISDFTEANLGQVTQSFSREIFDAASEFVGAMDENMDDNQSDRNHVKPPKLSLLETTIGFFIEDDSMAETLGIISMWPVEVQRKEKRKKLSMELHSRPLKNVHLGENQPRKS